VLEDVGRRPFTDAEQAHAKAPLDDDPLISYGCTLLLAVLSSSWVGLLQIGTFFAMDLASSSTITQEVLGWTPTGPTLLEDLDSGSYFRD